MCGISGWFAREGVTWRPDKDFICDLIKGIETRGHDATGYGAPTAEGKLYIYKGPLMPYRFMVDLRAEDIPIGPAGLVHTRAANVGSADDNNNNHPVFYESDGRAVIVTHNGTVGNLDEAYAKLGVEPIAEVDSALIPAALCKLGVKAGLEFLQKESGGSAAFAALFDNGDLVLARDSSPLFIAQPMPGVLLWSSEADPMKKMSEHANEFDLPMWRIWGVSDRQFWHWNKHGEVLARGKFNLPAMTKPPEYMKSKSFQTTYGVGATDTKTPTNNQIPMSEMAKRACGYQKPATMVKLEGDVNEHVTRNDPQRCHVLEKGHNITCNWGGCWKKALFKIEWPSRVGPIPLCEKHKNKWQKKGHSLILSGTHEMARKTANLLSVKM